MLLLYHKLKGKWQKNAPITTTTDPGVTTTMRKNVCYIYSGNAMQERREIDGSYQYNYPYLSSMSRVDVTDIPSEGQLQAHQGINTVAANGEIESGNVATKQRSCDNEEDIYSYII